MSEHLGWAAQLFRKAMLKRAAFSGSYGKLKLLYSLEDPWEMASQREQHRFRLSNEQLTAISPRYASLLEIGCGEGHQSEYLAQLADQMFGMDISPKAVARAENRCPEGHFRIGRIEDVATIFPSQRFSLITACEVLYYTKNIPNALSILKPRTDVLYVSNFETRAAQMRHHFAGPGWQVLPPIQFGDTTWECYFWRED